MPENTTRIIMAFFTLLIVVVIYTGVNAIEEHMKAQDQQIQLLREELAWITYK